MPFSPEAADRAQRFFEKVLVHTKGRWAGVPFTLADWQRDEIIRPLFGTLRDDGLRQYRTAFVALPRKNGKSEIAAGIALYLLVADGEQGAEVYGAAADRDQASIVFNVAAEMVRRSPILRKRLKVIDSSKRIIDAKTGSFYRAIPADAAGSHGFNAHGIVFDELHTQRTRELWDVLTTSTGAREQPLVFAITTAGYDRESICWEQWEYARRVSKGVVDDPSFFAFIREAPEDADWTDERVWRAANPALASGFRSIEEMRTMAKKALETPALQNTFRCLYLNQWVQQESRWLDLSAWDATAGLVSEEELAGRPCFIGLDLSTTTDLTAMALLFPPQAEGEPYTVLPRFFLPGDGLREREQRDRVPYATWAREGFIRLTEGNVIDYEAVRQQLFRDAGRFKVLEVAYDPWNATQLALQLQGDGFAVVPVRQGFATLSAPTKELMRLVLARELRHGGNPVLRWQADSMVTVQDPAGNLKPAKHKSNGRIDGMVATIMALDRAMRNEQRPSVYEGRGIMVL